LDVERLKMMAVIQVQEDKGRPAKNRRSFLSNDRIVNLPEEEEAENRNL
jgi:hypothetical protein